MARSECCACGLTFSSSASFDKHRTGSYGDPIYDAKGRVVLGYAKSERRCLTEAEMLSKKMAQNDKGIWVTALFEGDSSFWKKEEVS